MRTLLDSELLRPLLRSSTHRRLAHGALWGGVTAVGTRGITLVSSFLLAHILGQTGFGEYGIVNNTAATVGSLAGMGIGQTVTKYIAELKRTDPERCGRVLALTTIVSAVSALLYGSTLFVFAPWLAERTLAAPHLAGLLRISAITVAFGVLNSVQQCSLIGCEAFKSASQVNIATTLIQALLVVLGAWRWGIPGAVAALAISMVITVALTRLAVHRVWLPSGLQLRWRGMTAEWRVLVHYSLPTFLILIFLAPVTWVTNAFLANQPDGYAELGLFNAALQWQVAINFLPSIICTAMIPVMSEKCGAGDVGASLRIMNGMIKALSLIIVPIALVLCALSPIIMRAYGADFSKGQWVMVLLVGAGALSAILTPFGNFIMASGLMWMGFFVNFGLVITTLVGGWYGVRWGAEGLAASRLLAMIVHCAFVYALIRFINLRAQKAKA